MGTRIPALFPLFLFSIFSLILNQCFSGTVVEPGTVRSFAPETEFFRLWRETHGRIYNDDEETGKPFDNFKSNLKYVDEMNAERRGFSVGLNRFADLSNEEFREMYFGDRKKRVRLSQPRFTGFGGPVGTCDGPLHVDWRKKGAVTPVKDQGACGSSWAYSSVGAIEGINAINSGELISFSEQALVDCDKTNYGCDGGSKDNAFYWVINNGVIHTQSDYPCTKVRGTCNANKVVNNSVYIDGYESIEESESALRCAVLNQPISADIHGSSIDFQLYTGGIYDGACSSNPDDIDHSVLIVGYGSEGYKDYWIVKNSWGSDWGVNGYMYIRRNINLRHGVCAINFQASYPTQTSPFISSNLSPSAAPTISPLSPPPPPPSSPPPPSPVSHPPPPSVSPPPSPPSVSPPPSPPPPQSPSLPPPPYYPSSPPSPSSHHCGEYTYCSAGQTCCCLYESSGFCMIHGCCDYINGLCCSGTDFCCPQEYPICDPDEGFCLKKSGDNIGVPGRKKNVARLKLPWTKTEERKGRTYEPLQWRKAAMR